MDIIYVRNLSLPHPVDAPNCWGHVKPQPALVSLKISLQTGFGSAADGDKLDDSTVHYGVLAKQIRAACWDGMEVEDVLEQSFDVVEDLAKSGLANCEVRVRLPKGAMLGDAVEVVERRGYGNLVGSERTFELKSVRVPVLIGVNAYERSMKQPLVFDLQATYNGDRLRRDLFALEKSLVETVQDTGYETLETLVDVTVRQLREKLLDQVLPGGSVMLRIEKPMAIPFADAPAVEVTRGIPT